MDALLDLWRVLIEPTAVFERVRERLRLLPPFLGLAAGQVVVAILLLPYSRAAMRAVAAQAAGGPAGPADPGRFAVFGVAFVPIGLAVGLLLTALILWVFVSLLGEEAKFKLLFGVATYAAVTQLLLGVAGLAVLMLRGVEGVASPADLQPALGLDLLVARFAEPGRWVESVLRAINPFSIWGLALTALGVSTTHKLGKGTGYTVATLAFLLGVLLFSLLALLGPGGASR